MKTATRTTLLAAKLSRINRDSIQLGLRYYKDGLLAKDFLDFAAYGDQPEVLEQLSAKTGHSGRMLHMLRKLVEVWPRPVFEKLLKTRMPNGRSIPAGFLLQVAQVDDAAIRRELIKLLKRRNFSSRLLAAEICRRRPHSRGGLARRSGGPRRATSRRCLVNCRPKGRIGVSKVKNRAR